MADHIQVYEDSEGGFRWRRVAGNGEITADSAESYTRRWSAKRAASKVMPGLLIVYC